MLSIENDYFIGQVNPQQGARLLSLQRKQRGGLEPIVLAPCEGQLIGQKATAFPLIPFGGRLQDGIFAWQDGNIRLPCQPGQCILHGDGSRRPWNIHDHTPESITMGLEYPSQGWPFPARIQMRYLVRGPSFKAIFYVRNLSASPIPFGLGWHPYFAFAKDHWLTLNVKDRAKLTASGFSPKLRPEPRIQTFSAGDGPATWQFRFGGGSIQMGRGASAMYDIVCSSSVDHVVIHLAPNQDSIAIEPMSHPLHDPGASVVPGNGRKSMAVMLRLR